jgi:hypothetical protein
MASTITINSSNGFCNITNFNFSLDSVTLSSYNTFLWNFGDGSTSRNPNPSYTYSTPGSYTVTLNAYDNKGNHISVNSNLNVNYFLNESIIFDTVPPPSFAGHLNRYPFKINITSSSNEPHYINLGAQYSKSYQYQEPENNWSFLRPQWRFLDLSGNQIDQIKTNDTAIYTDANGNLSSSGFFAGVTGTAEFYFIDDLYNNDLYASNQPYSTIIATLQTSALRSNNDSFNYDNNTPSYANSLAQVILPHIFLWREPDYLNITENGINQIPSIKFTNQNVPILLNFAVSSIYDRDYIKDGNGVTIANANEFIHYAPYNSSFNINVSASLINYQPYPLSSQFDPSNIEFVYNDEYGFDTSGYYKGSLYCYTSTFASHITGASHFPLPDLTSVFVNPILWVSNPEAGMFSTIQYTQGAPYINSFNMPIVDPSKFNPTDTMPVSGFHGINAIASVPNPSYHAWLADSELNVLYRVNSIGQILCSIDLNAIINTNAISFSGVDLNFTVPNQCSPTCISLDSQQNLWVTLYDTPYAFKFDKFGNPIMTQGVDGNPIITHTILKGADPVSNWWNDSTSIYGGGETAINPSFIETDLDDNIWITYSNPFSSILAKYDTVGNYLTSINYPLCTCPQQLLCNNENNIWVVNCETVSNLKGYIEKRDTYGNLLSSFGPFSNINHLTIDMNQNIWFTYSYHYVATINNNTGQIDNVNVIDYSNPSYSDIAPNWFDPNNNTGETILEGITCDTLGRIFVLNSMENKIFVIDSNSLDIYENFLINPKGFVFSLSGINAPTEVSYDRWSKSLQATGDWSGMRWANKYNTLQYTNTAKYIDYNGVLSKKIYGNSASDNNYISFYSNNYYDLFKINENFDFAGQMKNISFQQVLNQSTFLYDNFLGSIFGKAPFDHDGLGIKSYEKTANYVSNISDIDTCNVNNLYDLSNSIDLNSDDFRLDYPVSIQRLMDLLSINQSRLFGSTLQDNDNFNDASQYSNFNRGEKLNTLTYTVTAGVPIVLKSKTLNSYRLIPTGAVNNSNFYSLNDLATSISLSTDWHVYYEFFQFTPMMNNIDVENIIDWNTTNLNKQELLTYLKSPTAINEVIPNSILGWTTNEGIMEFLFTYELYKGFGLI